MLPSGGVVFQPHIIVCSGVNKADQHRRTWHLPQASPLGIVGDGEHKMRTVLPEKVKEGEWSSPQERARRGEENRTGL